jgi:hypothetical protein
MAKPARKSKAGKAPRGRVRHSDYFTQPGKRGSIVVLRKPIGNRATAKICGTMPSRVHAKMLIDQLERAESVVKDLFLEATDDGIEALEAVLAACCTEVVARGPKQRPTGPSRRELVEPEGDDAPADAEGAAREPSEAGSESQLDGQY